VIEGYTYGARLDTCPWKAFVDPVVRDVLTAYGNATDREGNAILTNIRALNPPAHVWDGVQMYSRVLARNVTTIREIEEAKRKR